jgi:PAS domain S-box-containing protein
VSVLQNTKPLKDFFKNDDYYKTIFNSTNDIFIITNNDLICDFNTAFIEFFLKDKDSCNILLDTRSIGELFEKIDKYGFVYDGYLKKRWYEVAESNPDRYYNVGIKKNDKLFIFNISVKTLDISEGARVISLTEITDRFEHKEELENELNIISKDKDRAKILLKQYQKAIDESNLVSKTDTQGIIIYVNDAFCNKLQYLREELIGHDHSIVRSPRTTDEIYNGMWQTIKSGQVWHGIVEDIDKNGKGHYFNSTIIPIIDDNGDIAEFLAIRQDVSEIFAAKLEASRALEVKTNFLNQVSHELRTPMNAIINFVGQVLDDYDDILHDETFRKMAKNFLMRAQNNSKNLLQMINTLLDAAKLESGR